VEALEKHYIPKIDSFTTYIDLIYKQIEDMKMIIKKFDENLSLKANKNLL